MFSADRLLAIPVNKWAIRGKLISWENNDKAFSGGQDVGLGSWRKSSQEISDLAKRNKVEPLVD